MRIIRYNSFINESTNERQQLRNHLIDDLLVEITDKFPCKVLNKRSYSRSSKNIFLDREPEEANHVIIKIEKTKKYCGIHIEINRKDQESIVPIIESIVQKAKDFGLNTKYRDNDNYTTVGYPDHNIHIRLNSFWIVIS